MRVRITGTGAQQFALMVWEENYQKGNNSSTLEVSQIHEVAKDDQYIYDAV